MDQRTYNTICRWHAFLKLKILSFINSDCDLQRSEAYKIGLEFILVSWSDIISINAFCIHKVADKKKIAFIQ